MEPENIFELYRDYLENEKQMAARSVRDYLEVFQKVQRKVDLFAEPSYKQVNDAVKQIKEEESLSPNTVYKFTICLRGLTRWLAREEYTPRNVYPFSDWKKPKPSTPKFLTGHLFNSIMDDHHLSKQEETLLYTFWDTAGRLSEVAALTQQDFFFDQKFYLDEDQTQEAFGHYARISYEISKGHYSFRNVPITENLKSLLLRQFRFAQTRGHKEKIFLNAQNEPMTASGISKAIHNIGMRQSPLRPSMNLSAHMFRHSFGIRMLERGVPQVIVQKWLGHQSLAMTSHYINMAAESAMRIFRQQVSQVENLQTA